MSAKKNFFYTLSLVVLAFAMVAGTAVLLDAQDKPQAQKQQRVPGVEDWSTHHLVFSNPGNFAQGTRNRPFTQWYKLQNEPRYQMFLKHRNADRTRPRGTVSPVSKNDSEESVESFVDSARFERFEGFGSSVRFEPAAIGGPSPRSGPGSRPIRPAQIKKVKPLGDWNTYLGGTTSAGIGATFYPAKYTWDINAAPDCTNDFLVVPINKATTSAVTATGTATVNSTNGLVGNTITIGGTTYTWVSGAPTSANQVRGGISHPGNAQDLQAAVNANSGQCATSPCFGAGTVANASVTASGATGVSSVVTLTSKGSGTAGNFTLTSSDGGNVAVAGGNNGVDGQASIVAFNNLYTADSDPATQTGVVSGNTLTPPDASTITIDGFALNTSDPTKKATTITFGTTRPSGTANVVVGTITYTFVNASTVPAGGTNACNIRSKSTTPSDSSAQVALNLYNAIHSGTAGQSTTTWMCNAALTTGNAAVASSFSSPTISLTAATYGSTGYTSTRTGTTNFSVYTNVEGTNGTTGGTAFAYWSGAANISAQLLANNIVSAINTNTATTHVTAHNAGGTSTTITLTANTAGSAGNSIALLSGLGGFTWNGGTLTGGVDITGACGSGQPHLMWAYNASTRAAGTMLGSPVLSLDGTKVAFVETSGSGSTLHILNWNAGDGAANIGATPPAPTTVKTAGDGSSCGATTSCMFSLPLGASADTNSPPFYDYGLDTLYVGDNAGNLRAVSPVFGGTAEPAVAWTATPHAAILTGPVADPVSGNIFVGDSLGQVSAVSSAGVVSGTPLTGLGAVADPVIVDSASGQIYVFSGGNATAALVSQSSTSLGTAASVNVGIATGASQIHTGTFDNTFYTSADGTGNLYVCGKGSTGSNAGPVLYSIPIASGVMGGSVGGSLPLSSSLTGAQQCSPISEVYNPSGTPTDWLFLGVQANCAFGGSATGCVMAFDITSGFPGSANKTAAENGGTSGIVIDNVSSTTGASSLYFTTLLTPGPGGCTGEPSADSTTCVVKRTQNGLK